MEFNPRRSRELMASINIIPLVDVVLVLLIIFMVTAPMMYRGIDVNLPQSSTNTIKSEERIVMTVTKNRDVYLDKEKISIDRLEYTLSVKKKQNPNITLYLRGDSEALYGVVVKVMDAARKAGIDKLGMVTEPVFTNKEG
ncbi:MAG: biopolymer transporter ExbD [Nitrospirae bacterium]|nr:biopolymer transporter ExbD [Nitrospirota bacterium]